MQDELDTLPITVRARNALRAEGLCTRALVIDAYERNELVAIANLGQKTDWEIGVALGLPRRKDDMLVDPPKLPKRVVSVIEKLEQAGYTVTPPPQTTNDSIAKIMEVTKNSFAG